MSGATKLMTAGGGGVNLTPASSIASDVTVNVPSQNCTLGIQGPAFSAVPNAAQTFSAATSTKVAFQTKEWDTANCFDNATNYRFTPNVAGYYQFSACVSLQSSGETSLTIRKNGSLSKVLFDGNAGVFAAAGGAQIYFNGTTDYAECWYYSAVPVGSSTASFTYFQAAMVRSA